MPQAIESTFGVDFNAGMMVYGNYYFGMSVYSLLEDKLNLSGSTTTPTGCSAATLHGVLLARKVTCFRYSPVR